MFGVEPFAIVPVGVAPIEFGPIDADVAFVTFAKCSIDLPPVYYASVRFLPGRSDTMYADNDTDFIVNNLVRMRDQSPINDASLYGSIARATVTGPITNATNASPIVITSEDHGLSTGDEVFVNGVEGNLAANGPWTITRIDANSFSLDDSDGDGDYIEGGQWWQGVPGAMGVAIEYQSGSNGQYVGTIDAAVDMPVGSYVRFVTCDNYGIRFGPTTFQVTNRT